MQEAATSTEAQRHQVLIEWNDTAVDYPLNAPLHQLIEDQVARTPEATALVCESIQLTYQDLNARANQLAHYLISLGVAAKTSIGPVVLELSKNHGVHAGDRSIDDQPALDREQHLQVIDLEQRPVVALRLGLRSGLGAHEITPMTKFVELPRAQSTLPFAARLQRNPELVERNRRHAVASHRKFRLDRPCVPSCW